MSFPKQIKIYGAVYDVSIVDVFEDGCMGEVNYPEQTIKVRRGKEDFMWQTLWHEIFHAINTDFTEREVEMFSNSIYQVQKDNPELFIIQEKGGEK